MLYQESISAHREIKLKPTDLEMTRVAPLGAHGSEARQQISVEAFRSSTVAPSDSSDFARMTSALVRDPASTPLLIQPEDDTSAERPSSANLLQVERPGRKSFSRPYLSKDAAGRIYLDHVLVESIGHEGVHYDHGGRLLPRLVSFLLPQTKSLNPLRMSGASRVQVTKLPPCFASIRLAVVALFFGLASGVVEPVTMELIRARVCHETQGFSDYVCDHLTYRHEKEHDVLVSQEATQYTFLLDFTGSFPCALLALFTGSWSDHFGRKLLMILPFCGMFLGAVILVLFGHFPTHPGALVMYPFISSLFGGWIVASAAIYSFMGDYCSHETLAVNMAVFDGTLILATNVGRIVGGALFQVYGYSFPYGLYAALMAVVAIYIAVAVRDRMAFVEHFKASKSHGLFTKRNLMENKEMLWSHRTGNTRWHIWLLVLCIALNTFCSSGEKAILPPFYENEPMNWAPKQYPLVYAMGGIITGGVTMVAVPVFKEFYFSDISIGIAGIVSTILSCFILSFTSQSWMGIASAVVAGLSGLENIAIRTLLSNWVEDTERGKMMSLFASFETMVSIVGSFIFTYLFSAHVAVWPGFSFAFSTLILIPVFVAFVWIRRQRNGDAYELEEPTHTKHN